MVNTRFSRIISLLDPPVGYTGNVHWCDSRLWTGFEKLKLTCSEILWLKDHVERINIGSPVFGDVDLMFKNISSGSPIYWKICSVGTHIADALYCAWDFDYHYAVFREFNEAEVERLIGMYETTTIKHNMLKFTASDSYAGYQQSEIDILTDRYVDIVSSWQTISTARCSLEGRSEIGEDAYYEGLLSCKADRRRTWGAAHIESSF